MDKTWYPYWQRRSSDRESLSSIMWSHRFKVAHLPPSTTNTGLTQRWLGSESALFFGWLVFHLVNRHQMGSGWHLCQRGLHPEETHASGGSARYRGEGCAQVRLAAVRSRQPRLVGSASLLATWTAMPRHLVVKRFLSFSFFLSFVSFFLSFLFLREDVFPIKSRFKNYDYAVPHNQPKMIECFFLVCVYFDSCCVFLFVCVGLPWPRAFRTTCALWTGATEFSWMTSKLCQGFVWGFFLHWINKSKTLLFCSLGQTDDWIIVK